MENAKQRFLTDMAGIGPKRKEALDKAKLFTYEDLALHLPSAYRDYEQRTLLRQAQPLTPVCVKAKIASVQYGYKDGTSLISASLQDQSGSMQAIWFHQPYLRQKLIKGEEKVFYGMVTAKDKRLRFVNPLVLSLEEAKGIEAVYPPVKDFPMKTLRTCTQQAVKWMVENALPPDLPRRYAQEFSLLPYAQALLYAHQPPNMHWAAQARRTLSFYELFFFQLALMCSKKKEGEAVPLQLAPEMKEAFLSYFPFAFTGAQLRAMEEIQNDLTLTTPMARLLQGDVGSGKTAVAFYALFICLSSGMQGALMAPTEILARQHYESALPLFSALGYRVCCLTGSMKEKEKKVLRQMIAQGEIDLVIGTHALIADKVVYHKLGLVICDEQHRFGVGQRLNLTDKASASFGEEKIQPHVLVMSATPIPRTLALILYCDLEVSVLDELPPGRQKVDTFLVREEKREDMYLFCKNLLAQGQQMYVVCPLVEDSQELSAQSAQSIYPVLCKKLAPFHVGLVHGRMSGEEKERVLTAFYEGKTQVLVSTTVIEVGINVPNATVMMIEDADRFGLSQLHQLRGRVGRGKTKSYCFLLAQPNERLQVLCKTNDGFVIAQKDLELRGPGELIGTRQSGVLDPGIAAMNNQLTLLTQTHALAKELKKDEALSSYACEKYLKNFARVAYN